MVITIPILQMRKLRPRDFPKDIELTNTGTNFRVILHSGAQELGLLCLWKDDHIRKSLDLWVQRLGVPSLKSVPLIPLGLVHENRASPSLILA